MRENLDRPKIRIYFGSAPGAQKFANSAVEFLSFAARAFTVKPLEGRAVYTRNCSGRSLFAVSFVKGAKVALTLGRRVLPRCQNKGH